jgi:taurine transport system permease protein
MSKTEMLGSMPAEAADPRTPDKLMPFRGGRFSPRPRVTMSILGFVLLFGFWQLATSLRWMDPFFLPSPVTILQTLIELLQSGELLQHLRASFSRILLGWVAGTVAGVGVGLAIGLLSIARAMGIPAVSALYPIPKIALLPLFIIWFGIGEPSKYVMIGLGVFFPTVIAAYTGVDGVPRNLIRMGQSFNLSAASIVRKIVLPGALPNILGGFRVSAAVALLLLVSAEMIGTEHGLGAFVLTAGNLMNTSNLLAGVMVISIIGLAFGIAISALERVLLRWR